MDADLRRLSMEMVPFRPPLNRSVRSPVAPKPIHLNPCTQTNIPKSIHPQSHMLRCRDRHAERARYTRACVV